MLDGIFQCVLSGVIMEIEGKAEVLSKFFLELDEWRKDFVLQTARQLLGVQREGEQAAGTRREGALEREPHEEAGPRIYTD
jgi:hypothetical protein